MSTIRSALKDDLDALENIEQRCFSGDKLSRRSFKSLIKPGAHSTSVILSNESPCGYSIVLFRTGTSLARLYSIALDPSYRGQGLAQQLLAHAETQARDRDCLFMRLEVRIDNPAAIALYEKLGYSAFDRIDDYYEDGCTALRFEKRLQPETGSALTEAPIYYRQTTEFSCGPAALMMAMANIDSSYPISRREELQIWREATTIFMTTGHGGSSPHGLALAALKRGFGAHLYINRSGTPFIDSVRSDEKRQVIELVHQDFSEQLEQYPESVEINPLGPGQFREILDRHSHVIALISTWALNRNRAPHWVYVSKTDEHFVYISDPDTNDSRWQSETDFMHVPISINAFTTMASFGRNRLRCLLAIHPQVSE
ncbi:GNAT family N-acetyltransferase/peptidase C39 family protein [Zhongshania sp. BJYM1]|jgi:ribosomal protein S18 acetylase RimI-like enzyme/predicted double-glycine peptidase|uniref:GNAT family N-acetyltransferase/peptidase C39 family protein n=1 Tax=Zhongshania aquatica TaxID=2965069 RepID=UPI0022B58369|nr:GNAT family N-acetyltransferase/peptidase C39 family protein [Marortus sp. BJYM1]